MTQAAFHLIWNADQLLMCPFSSRFRFPPSDASKLRHADFLGCFHRATSSGRQCQLERIQSPTIGFLFFQIYLFIWFFDFLLSLKCIDFAVPLASNNLRPGGGIHPGASTWFVGETRMLISWRMCVYLRHAKLPLASLGRCDESIKTPIDGY